jgi:hypothetical protein
VSAAATGSVLAARLRGALRFTQPLSGALLVASGGYLIATNLAVFRDAAGHGTHSGRVADASAQASSAVQSVYLWFAPVLLVLLVLAGVLALARRRADPGPRTTRPTASAGPNRSTAAQRGVGAPVPKADAPHDAERTP